TRHGKGNFRGKVDELIQRYFENLSGKGSSDTDT
ncbi:MAG: hypothetical protein UW20_C0018G0007, partial [Candidatus Woesebacteria bacterium GW2011_GWB1_44_11]